MSPRSTLPGAPISPAAASKASTRVVLPLPAEEGQVRMSEPSWWSSCASLAIECGCASSLCLSRCEGNPPGRSQSAGAGGMEPIARDRSRSSYGVSRPCVAPTRAAALGRCCDRDLRRSHESGYAWVESAIATCARSHESGWLGCGIATPRRSYEGHRVSGTAAVGATRVAISGFPPRAGSGAAQAGETGEEDGREGSTSAITVTVQPAAPARHSRPAW